MASPKVFIYPHIVSFLLSPNRHDNRSVRLEMLSTWCMFFSSTTFDSPVFLAQVSQEAISQDNIFCEHEGKAKHSVVRFELGVREASRAAICISAAVTVSWPRPQQGSCLFDAAPPSQLVSPLLKYRSMSTSVECEC